ncbi:MAG: DegT/DnrJ/EryC1/StrS family aminotransferase [Planctomycetes bacterium]|nr:DegT/DnrJ/EryC1/StrS family aminotransferase [Planctomycetota bacterium]
MRSVDKSVKELLSGEGKNIPLFKVFMPESILEPLGKVLMSGYIGEGPRVEEFEHQLGELWFDNNNVLAVNNGTAALQLALRLAGVGHNDEVISTAMTCSATNEPIMAMGAKIIWADIDPWTANIDPEDVARKITPKTKAIMCVHWGGYPCDLDELNAIAAKHKIKLIEDACHSFGSTYQGKPIGSHSDFACFSFQAIKHMTTIDGGALVCKSEADCEKGRLLRWYGIDRKSKRKDLRCEADIIEYGYKFHMNDVTATIGLEQLKYVADTIKKHQANATIYNEAFSDLKTVRPLRYKDNRRSAYWLYTMRVKDRCKFMEHMKKMGITVSQVHARNDMHTMFKDFRAELPGVDEFISEQISIPVGWWLTDEDLTTIVNAVVEYDHSCCATIQEISNPSS